MHEERKPISERSMNVVKGLFLILFSIALGLNADAISRTFAFVPIYLFGAGYYILLLIMLAGGVYRLLVGKRYKIHFKTVFIGSIFIVLGFLFILGFALFKANGLSYTNGIANNINGFHAGLNGYYKKVFINLFESGSYWSTGLFTISIGSLIGNDTIVLLVGIMAVILGLGIISYHPVRHFLSKDHKKPSRVKNVTPIEIKPKEEPKEIDLAYVNDKEPFINQNSGFEKISMSLDDTYHGEVVEENYNEFVPLRFDNSYLNKNEPQPQYNPFVKEEPVVEVTPELDPSVSEPTEEAEEEINYIESRPEPIEEEKPEINEELVKLQPQYTPLQEVESSNQVNVSTSNVSTPTEEVVKRERVVWVPPSPDILIEYQTEEQQELNETVAAERVEALNSILTDYKIGAKISGYTIGPSITRFNVDYESNVSSKIVEKYVQDISRRLGGVIARFAPIVQGESYSGLEVPNATITTVGFKETFLALPDVKKHPLAVAFGKDISGKVVYADFDEFPHMLVAGTTGSGKSIYVHSIISTLIMRNSPDDLKLVLVDPKVVEMKKYQDMPHLLTPIISDPEKAKVCLDKLCAEMNRRYDLFSTNGEVSNIKDYNKIAKEEGTETLPYIIVFVDEYADLVGRCKEIYQPVVSLAQKARAAGIHMCLATQRPSTDVVTGVLKGNIPTHVALMTSSPTDSVVILGEGGAETLLGKGDMLVQSPLVSRVGVVRLQGCYIQNKEIVNIVGYLKNHYHTYYDPQYLDLVDHSKETANNMIASGEYSEKNNSEDSEEAKYQSIKEYVMGLEYVSMSKIQRDCMVGFNRAGRIFARLRQEGIVSNEQDGSNKGSKVLVHDKFYSSDSADVVTSDELIGK